MKKYRHLFLHLHICYMYMNIYASTSMYMFLDTGVCIPDTDGGM